MPRTKPRREPCDCVDCSRTVAQSIDSSLHCSLARQDPPPKSVVLILDGVLYSGSTVVDLNIYPNLDQLALHGGCGRISAAITNAASVDMARQLVEPKQGTLPAVFQDIHVALFSNSDEFISLGRRAECQKLELLEPMHDTKLFPDVKQLAHRIATVLGVQPLEAYINSTSLTGNDGDLGVQDDVDMAVCVIKSINGGFHSASAQPEQNLKSSRALLAWADSLLSALDGITGFRDTVIFTLVITPGPYPTSSVVSHEDDGMGPDIHGRQDGPRVRRPRQSAQFSGILEVKVDWAHLGIVIHRLDGVIRRDRVESLDMEEITSRGGGGCILAERVIPEIAYKIGRAPKYGA